MSLAQGAQHPSVVTEIVGTQAVRVAYSDESGVGSKKDEPLTVVTAIVMNMDKCWPTVESELKKIISDTPKSLVHEDRELKGSLLYSAARKDIPEACQARESLARTLAITVNEGIPIFYGAVDREGYDRSLPQDERKREKLATSADVAFDACLARVDNFARADDEQILWIADHSDPTRERKTKVGLLWTRFLKDMGWDPLTYQHVTPKYESVRIADAIYFGHSHESLALQLADVCCSTVTLHLLETYYGWRPCAEPFYRLIQLQVMNGGPALFMSQNLAKGGR